MSKMHLMTHWPIWYGRRRNGTFLGVFLLFCGLGLTPALGSALFQPTPLLAQETILNPLANITQVAIGGSHTCALTASGDVLCWGANLYGQLGDGGSVDKLTPVSVHHVSSDVRAISAAWRYTCALSTSGGVTCWGSDGWQRSVSGLRSGVTAISTGEAHACALMADGGVLCWGDNDSGQLGDGTTTDQATPVAVQTLHSGVTAITIGKKHTCALTTGGEVLCWGNNSFGQLGDGAKENKVTPVAVDRLPSGVTAISAGGDHTCALLTTGEVFCWGSNVYGQLGDGANSSKTTPVAVNELHSGVAAIGAGYVHTCALTTDGAVHCWGGNYVGQLGDGSTLAKSIPTPVTGLGNPVTALAINATHSCAIITGGRVQCWGANEHGQLGNGISGNKKTPTPVQGVGSGITAISAGGYHSCALTSQGEVKCWGYNSNAQLGDGTSVNQQTPVNVSGLDNDVIAISAGESHTCVLRTGGGVRCWGGAPPAAPVDVAGLNSGVTAISAGQYHTCALTANGEVKCWGHTNGLPSVPVAIAGLNGDVKAISAGSSHTCALTTSDGVQCWGDNDYGQLGDGTASPRTGPVAVSGLDRGVIAISAGQNRTCAVTTSGGVKCWGLNQVGLPDDGASNIHYTPVDVPGLQSDATNINLGVRYACALMSNGRVQCWEAFDQIVVNNARGDRRPPTVVDGLSNVMAVSAGWHHACALNASGGVQCWGFNHGGQLGDGTAWSTTPVTVIEAATLYLPLVLR